MIGSLDQEITIERRVRAADGAGGYRTDWQKLDCDPCVWAAVKPRAVREARDEGRISAAYLMQFTIRNRADVDETCRILWSGRVWNIKGVMTTGARSTYLTLEAERGGPS